MSEPSVEAVNTNNVKSSGTAKPVRSAQITVRKGENLASIAKRFGMSPKDFVAWAGLKRASVSEGQKINLPTDTVPKGKGIYVLAKKYNMTLEEFGKLNNLPKPYNKYSASAGERFYVKKNAGAKNGNSGVSETQKKWGSKFTPQQIATTLENEASDRCGAVGKENFDKMIKEINPKNASAVIKAYDDADYGQSLINRITHEIWSSKDSRKKAVMHVYDALAKEKNISNSVRKEFEKELNDRFDDWGMVDTKKLDSTINKIISGEIKGGAKSSTINKSKNKKVNSSTVKLSKNPGKFTVSSLQQDAINSAKNEALDNFKLYCKANNIPFDKDKLDLRPLNRLPAPAVRGSSVVADESALLKPTTKPNGKVVILNPGHGGYSSRTGYFDPGSYSFIKKGNGKYAPLLEYEKMKGYAESLSEKLRAKGYAVVITSAHVQTVSDQRSISNLVKNLNTGKKGNQKYDKNNIVFISLHADSEPGKSGSGVCYDSRFSQDTRLANVFKDNLNTDDWITAKTYERNWTDPKKKLQVLHQTEDIPSVLLEVEYVNGSKSKNLDSSAYQNRFENKIIQSLSEYYK